MDRLEPRRGTLGECERCKQFKLLAFTFWHGDKSRLLCVACGGQAAIYLHKNQ